MTYMPAYCDPDNEFRGEKYTQTAGKSTTEIAKFIREDIKAMKAQGKIATEVKVSVTSESFAGGSAIRLKVKEVPFSLYSEEYKEWVKAGGKGQQWQFYQERGHRETQSKEVIELLALLKAVGNSYNRDNSDSMTDYFDVRFYLTVDLDYDMRHKEFEAM